MKPTGATKKLTDWTVNEQLVNTAIHAESYKERVDARVKIIAQLNERERLREALRLATQINTYGDPANLAAKEAVSAVLNEQQGEG